MSKQQAAASEHIPAAPNICRLCTLNHICCVWLNQTRASRSEYRHSYESSTGGGNKSNDNSGRRLLTCFRLSDAARRLDWPAHSICSRAPRRLTFNVHEKRGRVSCRSGASFLLELFRRLVSLLLSSRVCLLLLLIRLKINI